MFMNSSLSSDLNMELCMPLFNPIYSFNVSKKKKNYNLNTVGDTKVIIIVGVILYDCYIIEVLSMVDSCKSGNAPITTYFLNK